MDNLATAIDPVNDDASLEAALSANFGEETPTESADPGVASAQPPAVSGEAKVAVLEAPKHWSEGDRGLFAKAPAEIQKRWIDRETEQQRGLDTKFQEIAGFRKEREQLDEVFSKYARDLQLRGQDRVSFIKSLVGAHEFLLEKPSDAFKWLAQEYGFDLKKLNEPGTVQDSAALKEIAEMRKQLGGFMQTQQQAQLQSNLQKVQSFAEAKDDKGVLLHPYFDEVAETILTLQKAGTKDLEAAYNKAVRMDDKVWDKLQAEKAKATTRKMDDEAKARIDKAKRAGKTSTTTTADGQSRPQTLEEQLAAGFANYGT